MFNLKKVQNQIIQDRKSEEFRKNKIFIIDKNTNSEMQILFGPVFKNIRFKYIKEIILNFTKILTKVK